MAVSDTSKLKVAASGLIPFAFVIVLMLYIFGPGGDLLDFGIALPEITIEKVVSYLSKYPSGSTAAGCILSFTSATTT